MIIYRVLEVAYATCEEETIAYYKNKEDAEKKKKEMNDRDYDRKFGPCYIEKIKVI